MRLRRIFWGGFAGFVLGEIAGIMIGGIGPCGPSGWAFLGLATGPLGAVAYPQRKRHLLKRRPLEWDGGA